MKRIILEDKVDVGGKLQLKAVMIAYQYLEKIMIERNRHSKEAYFNSIENERDRANYLVTHNFQKLSRQLQNWFSAENMSRIDHIPREAEILKKHAKISQIVFIDLEIIKKADYEKYPEINKMRDVGLSNFNTDSAVEPYEQVEPGQVFLLSDLPKLTKGEISLAKSISNKAFNEKIAPAVIESWFKKEKLVSLFPKDESIKISNLNRLAVLKINTIWQVARKYSRKTEKIKFYELVRNYHDWEMYKKKLSELFNEIKLEHKKVINEYNLETALENEYKTAAAWKTSEWTN